ncbi:MAG TPA: hypothetical protein ENJ08_14155 [Gammaproteobacteria bacterium]|nr:hypothetical protein [Gammaproteobacteria bacterium]
MNIHVDKAPKNKNQSLPGEIYQRHKNSESAFQFIDNRPKTIAQRKLQVMADTDSYENNDTIQRLTIAYTAQDIIGGVAPAPFAEQIIQQIVYQRAPIPHAVKLTVDAFGDNLAIPVTYKHHVAHNTIFNGIRNLCENESRGYIVENMVECLDAIYVDSGTFGVNPLDRNSVADFNSWLDSAIVSICDWPNNIFRGPSNGAALDMPTAPAPALTTRLNAARAVLQGLNFT